MDIEKAFDKVWHAGLIDILIKLGMPIIYIRYIHSWLRNRSIYVYVEGLRSGKIPINFGLPQGSALSAILFLLYVAGIPTPKTLNTYLSQFADDIKLYATGKSLKKTQANMHNALDAIIKFCGERRIAINEKKTFEIVIRPHHNSKENTPTPSLTFNGKEIKIEQSGPFLGVTFDEKLSFKIHFESKTGIAKKRSQSLMNITAPTFGPSPQFMIRLFKIFCRPIFDFGSIAFVTLDPVIFTPWENTQIRFIKHTLNTPLISHDNILKLANLPKIKQRTLHLAHNWYHKALQNNKDLKDFVDTKITRTNMKTPHSIITNTYNPHPKIK